MEGCSQLWFVLDPSELSRTLAVFWVNAGLGPLYCACISVCILSLSVCMCLSEIHTTPRSLSRGVIKASVCTGGCLWLTQWAPAHPAKDVRGVPNLYCPWKPGPLMEPHGPHEPGLVFGLLTNLTGVRDSCWD